MQKKLKIRTCQNCHAPIAKNEKICHVCGAKIKKPFFKKWWFIFIVIILIISGINSIKDMIGSRYNWNDIVLNEYLPKPQSNKGYIWTNTSEYLKLEVENISQNDYQSYIDKCEDMGYTIDIIADDGDFEAFNKNGIGISLSYYNDTMSVNLETPLEMETLNWPNNDLVNLLPIPNSKVGKVDNESSSQCLIYVGETSIDEFNNYVEQCINKGFNVDYSRKKRTYKANNINKNILFIEYEGNNIMSIRIEKPYESDVDEKEIEEPKELENNINQDSDATGIRTDFKQAMDSYERFIDEYCNFMVKYTNSNGTDLTLITDYASYVDKLEKAEEDFEKWNSETLNTEELNYYLEVQTRVTEKLLNVASN